MPPASRSIAYKLGRSDIGQELAKSHTGAIAGSDATFDAFCRRHGIARVSMFESLVDVPTLLVDRPPATGKRVAVATTTGGGAAMVVDNMAMAGLDIADPPQALVDWLKPLGIAAGEGKLVDLTLAGAKPEIVAGTIERLLADDGNDAAIFVVGSSAQFNPELAVEPLLRFAGIEEAVRRVADAGGGEVAGAADGGRRAGLPASRILRRGDGALPAAADAAAGAGIGRSRQAGARRSAPGRPRVGLRRAAGGGTVRARSASRWRSRSPCPMPARSPSAVDEIGGPVALKILSADIAHKTEAGGVALGLPDGQTAARRGARDREAGQGACAQREARRLPGAEDGARACRGDPGLPARSAGRADGHRRPGRRAGGDLQGRRDAACAGRRGRSAADDRRGEGPRHDPRLSQPAAAATWRRWPAPSPLSRAWPTRRLPRSSRRRSIRCW